ncbi:MAG TPA: ArsR family transcriptional regulator [Candidatus Bathyarchaeia archaeon]
MTLGELVVRGEDALKVADALTSTSFRMLQLLSKERLDVSDIAERLELSEAYMSGQIRLLEELKLIKVSYERGKRGIRKMCELAVKKVSIVITP